MQRTYPLRRTGVASSRNRDLDALNDTWKLEELRQAIRRELRVYRCGQESLARMAGVGRAVVRKLLEMRSVPEPENLGRLAEWAADRPSAETPLPLVCMAVLLDGLPAGERYRARLELAESLARLYREAGIEVPPWLVLEVEDRRRGP